MRRGNRVMWAVIGLILMAAGAVGALMSLGHFPGTQRHGTLFTPAESARWRSWGGWAPTVTIVIGLIVLAAGLALIRAELRRRGGRRIRDVVFRPPAGEQAADGGPTGGQTMIASSTLRQALRDDLQNNPSIRHVSVRITDRVERPRLFLRLEVAGGADLSRVHADVVAALDRFRVTSQLRPAQIETIISGA